MYTWHAERGLKTENFSGLFFFATLYPLIVRCSRCIDMYYITNYILLYIGTYIQILSTLTRIGTIMLDVNDVIQRR